MTKCHSITLSQSILNLNALNYSSSSIAKQLSEVFNKNIKREVILKLLIKFYDHN